MRYERMSSVSYFVWKVLGLTILRQMSYARKKEKIMYIFYVNRVMSTFEALANLDTIRMQKQPDIAA